MHDAHVFCIRNVAAREPYIAISSNQLALITCDYNLSGRYRAPLETGTMRPYLRSGCAFPSLMPMDVDEVGSARWYQQLPYIEITSLPVRWLRKWENQVWYLTGSSGGISSSRVL
jgi:hypothetical protein